MNPTTIEAYTPPPMTYPVGLFDPNTQFDDGPDIFDLPVEEEAVKAAATQPAEEDEPVIAGGSVSLRHYQQGAVNGVLKQFKGDKKEGIDPVNSTLVVSATGTGKSVVIADLARRNNSWGHGTLLLVHREELIKQLRGACARVGIHTLKEKANDRAISAFMSSQGTLMGNNEPFRTVVASVQTLRGDRLKQWPRDSFKLIITDECHHAPSPSYQAVYEHFMVGQGGARHVGFTATADRLDGKGLGGIFESLAFEYNIRDAIHDPQGPFLVPIEAFPVETNPVIDLKSLRVTAGDFNAGDLERAINDNIGVLVNAIVDNNALEDRRTIAFTPDVSSAQALAMALQDVGITANWVSGSSPNRDQVLASHQAGEFQVLVNCMILTEGYDDPEVSCILICRPTKSRALYSQMVGRGTRLHPASGKTNCRVVDFAYMTGTHKLVSPVDLYDNSNTDDAVVERARELVETGQERDIDAALEKAQEEFEEGERVRIQRRVVQSRAKTFDLIGACELLGIRQKADYNWNDVRKATPKMVDYAKRSGVEIDESAGFGSTKKVLDAVTMRRKYGLSTLKQVNLCIKLGAEPKAARKMSFQEAADYISTNKTW